MQISSLPAPGYILPLAPDKQGGDPSIRANLDATRVTANLTIFDDDVPGVQIISQEEHVTLEEGETSTFQVSLTAEPLTNVQIVLTAGAGFEFVSPVSPGTANVNEVSYALDSSALGSNIDINFISLSETDRGVTAVFDVRLATVTFGTSAKVSTMTIAGTNGGGSESVRFEIPGANDVDYAGDPVEGTWDIFQRVTVTNLKANGNGSYSFDVNLDGVIRTVTLTPATKQVTRGTTTLQFNGSNWFQLQTVTIRALENDVAEPGAWHKDFITYAVASTDANWNGLSIPAQEIRIKDTLLNVGDTIEGLGDGFNLLEDSLFGLSLPLIGNLGDLLNLGRSGVATSLNADRASEAGPSEPESQGFFEDFNRPLKKALASQNELTVSKFQSIAESALKPLVDAGLFDRVQVKPKATNDDVNILFHLDKVIHVGEFSLSADLGLEALGISFATTGKAKVDLAFSIDVGFGWNKEFGFYIDTGATGLQMGARLFLSGNGATTENPQNLFTGRGSIGPLQLDFTDDPQNQTELAVTFDISLNDLDNVNTVRFFDVNGDGLLAEKPYTYQVGVDANNDGRIDKDQNGNPITAFKNVAEAWTNVTANGGTEAFPTIPNLTNDVNLKDAVNANWSTVGSKANTFDEAQYVKQEGVYRVKKVNDQSWIVYLDVDRDGQLDISRRKADPTTLAWTSLTDAEKNSSEIWYTTSNPNDIRELKILVTGGGTSAQYFIDVDGDRTADASEKITTKLLKKLDKDQSQALEGDIIQDGEGKYVQGTSIAFYDADGDGKLDTNEKLVSYGFGVFQLDKSVLVKDSSGNYFLDFNNDGSFNSGQITTANEFKLKKDSGTGNFFLDIDNDGQRDDNEPQASATKNLLFIEQSALDQTGTFISFDGVGRQVIIANGKQFIDLDGNGVLTLDGKGRALEPVAEQTTSASFTDIARLVVAISTVDSAAVSSINAEIQKLKAEQNVKPGDSLTQAERQRVINQFAALVTAGKIVQQLNDGDRLTLTELKAFLAANRQANATRSDRVKGIADQLFTYTFQGDANLGLKTKTSINGNSVLPNFQFDLAVSLPLFNFSNSKEANNNGLKVQFKNVAIDLGSFLAQYVTPILQTTNDILKPIKPIIQALNADTKLLGKLNMQGLFESDGKPGISLLEIARKFTTDPVQQAKIDKAIRFADQLSKLITAIDKLTGSVTSESALITIGDFSLDDFRAASDDIANSAANARNTTPTNGAPAATATLPNATPASINAQAQRFSGLKDKYNALKQLEGFDIKLFNPSTVLSLITGESDVDLITYDVPDIDFAPKPFELPFRIWGPISGKFEGGFSVKTDLSVGFDTHGIEAWAKANYAPDKSYLVFDGFYADDWTPSGTEKDELTVRAFIAAGLGIDVGIASGFVKGGVEGTIGFDFVDVGERAGTSDGKIRGSDIIEKFSTNPADLFDLHGSVIAFLGAEINVNLLFFKAKVYEARLASFELARFTLDASGFKGSAMTGKVQAGPIEGALVWFDANNNFLFDDGEPWTLTDADGAYELDIPDTFDLTTGEIRVAGGVDVSTGLETTTSFTLPPGGNGNVTAFTSLIEPLSNITIDTSVVDVNQDEVIDEWDQEVFWEVYLYDPENPLVDIDRNGVVNELDAEEFTRLFEIAMGDGTMTAEQSEDYVKRIFNIDPSIDLENFAHFEEALAGNPLSIPVLLGINNLNTVVTQIESLLAGVSGIARSDKAYSAFLSRAIFYSIAKEMLDGRLDLGDPLQIRRIVIEAATLSYAWLAERNIDLDIPKLTEVLNGACTVIAASVINQRNLASTASSPQELARLITKAKVVGNGKAAEDLRQLGQGLVTVEQVVSEVGRTDEGALDEIRQVSLPPLVGNVSDVYLSEDSVAVGIALRIQSQSATSSTLNIQFLSDNASLLSEDSFTVTPGIGQGEFLLSIAPHANRNGTARVVLRVTDSSGSSVDRTFRVIVAAVNDDPVANRDDVLVVAGRTVVA
ncbi:MAG: hypothetical protein U1D30_16145 [Planctomycetota bacterium]